MSTKPPRARLVLPPLDGRTAITVMQILEKIVDAIWDAHRDAINEIQSDLTATPAKRPPRRSPLDDEDLF